MRKDKQSTCSPPKNTRLVGREGAPGTPQLNSDYAEKTGLCDGPQKQKNAVNRHADREAWCVKIFWVLSLLAALAAGGYVWNWMR